MTPRTLTAPVTDKRMWRKLLMRTHPDHGGTSELFVWVSALHEHVAGDALEDVRSPYQRRHPPPHYRTADDAVRVEYSATLDFASVTGSAVWLGEHGNVAEPFARLLRLLSDCRPAGPERIAEHNAQRTGATYKALAYAAHLAGMSKAERAEWYAVARRIPLSQRHIGHVISRLQEERGAA